MATIAGLIVGTLGLAFPPATSARSVPQAQSSSENDAELRRKIVGDRDLTLYDDGGTFIVGMGLEVGTYSPPDSDEFRQTLEVTAGARQFIWDHWTQQRRAYVRLVFTDADWSSSAHVFIEPDAGGGWNIAWRAVLEKNKIVDATPITAVKRVRLNVSENRWFFRGAEVPDSEVLEPHDYALVFVTSDGDERKIF
jgi:hypothetical protein